MFLSISIQVYDKIRKKKQLESEAIAKILIKDYKWKLWLWTNLVMCRLDKRSKEEIIENNNADEN